MNQAGPCAQCEAELRQQGTSVFQRAANHRRMWDTDPVMHAYATLLPLSLRERAGVRDSPDLARFDCTSAR